MPLIATPGRLARLGEFYHQLGAMLAAGLGLVQALEQIRNAPPSAFFRRPVQRLIDGLQQGLTFTEALTQLGRWLPAFDLALISAGEQSGRVDACCRLLADYYQERARLLRRIISDLAYPLVLLHAAVFLFPFATFFLSGDWVTYARQTLGVLAPLYLAVGLLIFACQGRHGELWRGWIERCLHPIPILGKARRHLALARLSAALEALLNAGVSMLQAWPLAAAASGSPALRRAVSGWEPHLQAGDPPGDLLQKAHAFPEMFTNLYRTGEISGTLDDTLKRLRTYYQDDATRKLQALSQWVPRLIYFAIVILIAMRIVGFWVNYYNGILGTDP